MIRDVISVNVYKDKMHFSIKPYHAIHLDHEHFLTDLNVILINEIDVEEVY